MKSTHNITYVYEVDGHTIEITRVHVRTAYARNGNVGNPTQYFKWVAHVDGQSTNKFDRRADAYEMARARVLGIKYVNNERLHRYVNVRPWTVVRDEMLANYRGVRDEALAVAL